MLNIYPHTKIYVHAPNQFATGGIELLHQLVHYLRNNGKYAFIVLFGDGNHLIHSEYKKYNISMKEEFQIEDNPCNIEIYSETMSWALKKNTRRTQKLMWWMSVDNFYLINKNDHCIYDMAVWNRKLAWGHIKHRLKMLLRYGKYEFSNKIWMIEFLLRGYTFAYQCEYIRKHLSKFGILNSYSLSDYINPDFFKQIHFAKKENIVLYNPSKGYEYTRKLIEASPDVNWVALRGYTRDQLNELMGKAKLYIDFGNHPGKDRLPRECAISGCCIITGLRGSAAFFKDVMIPKEYKFDEKKADINDIVLKIRYILKEYDTAIKDFSDYRKKILAEKSIFESEIDRLFSICLNNK